MSGVTGRHVQHPGAQLDRATRRWQGIHFFEGCTRQSRQLFITRPFDGRVVVLKHDPALSRVTTRPDSVLRGCVMSAVYLPSGS